MILCLDFNGYRFFDKESSLSFAADARTKKLLSNSEYIDGKNVLKSVGVYGANNSGKTNIATLFHLIKRVLLGKERISFNSMLFEDEINTTISIVFNNLKGNGWLKYQFTYNNKDNQYVYEKLSRITYYNSNNSFEKIIFEKDISNRILNIFSDEKSAFLQIIPSRLLLLYSINIEEGEFASLKEYYNEFIELANSIEVISMYNIPIENTIDSFKTMNKTKTLFIKEFVKSADISIDNFEYDPNIDFNLENVKVNEQIISI